MNKRAFLIAVMTVIVLAASGQAKKPRLMVVPSDAWCKEHGFTRDIENQGEMETISDYKTALGTDKDLNNVISKINIP